MSKHFFDYDDGDFACEKKRAVYAYYDTTPGGKLTQKL